MEAPKQTNTAPQKSSLRSTLLLAITLASISIGTVAYTSFLVPLRYELSMQPGSLPAIPGASAEIRVHGVSRAGSEVPFSDQIMGIDILEGAGLIGLSYNADSTRAILTSTGVEGLVNLRIRIPAWPFPLLGEIRIAASLAAHDSSSKTNLTSIL